MCTLILVIHSRHFVPELGLKGCYELLTCHRGLLCHYYTYSYTPYVVFATTFYILIVYIRYLCKPAAVSWPVGTPVYSASAMAYVCLDNIPSAQWLPGSTVYSGYCGASYSSALCPILCWDPGTGHQRWPAATPMAS